MTRLAGMLARRRPKIAFVVLATMIVGALVTSACDSWVFAHVTNDSSVDVIVYVNGEMHQEPPNILRKGTQDGFVPPSNTPLKSIEVVAIDGTGATNNQLTARIEFPGGTRKYTRLRLTGPPLVLAIDEQK